MYGALYRLGQGPLAGSSGVASAKLHRAWVASLFALGKDICPVNCMVGATTNKCGWCRSPMMSEDLRGVWAESFQFVLS